MRSWIPGRAGLVELVTHTAIRHKYICTTGQGWYAGRRGCVVCTLLHLISQSGKALRCELRTSALYTLAFTKNKTALVSWVMRILGCFPTKEIVQVIDFSL